MYERMSIKDLARLLAVYSCLIYIAILSWPLTAVSLNLACSVKQEGHSGFHHGALVVY